MMVYFMENPNLKWMITGGNPTLGNLHMCVCVCVYIYICICMYIHTYKVIMPNLSPKKSQPPTYAERRLRSSPRPPTQSARSLAAPAVSAWRCGPGGRGSCSASQGGRPWKGQKLRVESQWIFQEFPEQKHMDSTFHLIFD